MRFLRASDGQLLKIAPESEISSGGEARIYSVAWDSSLVAKIYHRQKPATGRKIRAMLASPPSDPITAQGHASIAWPVDLLQSETDGSVAGYLMPRVVGAHPILDLYNPSTRQHACPLFNYQYLYHTAQNLAALMHTLHSRDYVIGDVNESNVLVMDTALLTIVDTDSFQVPDPEDGTVYCCPVAKPEFTPPEMQGEALHSAERTPAQDRFGLAVLIFQLLMEGTHPFAGIYMGEGDPPPYQARIMAGHYPHGAVKTLYRPVPLAPPIEILPAVLRTLFQRCFEDGHGNPQARPHASAWVKALQEAENNLVVCPVNDQHLYGDHLDMCPWCRRTELMNGFDPFPSKLRVVAGRHLDPIPITSQTALPSAGTSSIAAAIAAMPPPEGIEQPANSPAAPQAGSLREVVQSLKPAASALASHFRALAGRLLPGRAGSAPARRITFTRPQTQSGKTRSNAQLSRIPWPVVLIALALIVAAVAIQLSHHDKPNVGVPILR